MESNGQFLWVQVKCTTHRHANGPSYFCNVRTCDFRRHYRCSEVDFFVLYIIPENLWYIIPARIVITMTNVLLSPHVIRARDEEHGYPDTNFLLCADPSAIFTEITVENGDVDRIRVVLGARGGILQIDVSDAATQRPISGAKAHDPRCPQRGGLR